MKSGSRLTRRQALRRCLGAIGASIAAPVVVRASALGRDGAEPPSERIGMGFVGLGGQGSGHLFGGAWTYLPGGYLGRKDVQVLGVCDVQQKRADEAKARAQRQYDTVVTAYTDIRDMLLSDDIDAVLIAASYHAQGFMSMLAARAGKDVYCEKPFTFSIRWGRATVEAVRRHGRVFQGGAQQRSEYEGRFRRAVELIRGGAIGKLKTVYANAGGGGLQVPPPGNDDRPAPPDVNWDAYVGPLPWFPYTGNTSGHAFGTGSINWGPHHYDIVQWGIGADDTGPTEIALEKDTVVYRYANGVEVFGCPPPGQQGGSGGATFVGTDGTINVHREVLTSDPPDVLRRSPGPEGRVYQSDSHSGNFLECIRTRQRTICDVEVFHRASSALLLGGIATQLRRKLTWDPKREEFVGDDEANRLLSLAPREGWRLG